MAQSFFVAADKACSVVVFPVFFFRMYSPVCVIAVLKTSFGNKDDTCAQLVKNKNKPRKNNFLTIKIFYLELYQLINKKNCVRFFSLFLLIEMDYKILVCRKLFFSFGEL